MQEFHGTVYNVALDEVRALVAAASVSGEAMFTVLNGVGLIADPCPYDPEYAEQLVWTYGLVSEVDDREVIGRRPFYQNLVPELRAQAIVLRQEFSRLDINDEPAVITWLTRLMPVSWCKWARPQGEEERELLARLATSSSALVREAGAILRSHHFTLTPEWCAGASQQSQYS